MRDQLPDSSLPTHPAPPALTRTFWHVAEETAKWKKISYFFGGVIVVPYTVFQLGKHLMHHQCRS